jgi:hypothetical protein
MIQIDYQVECYPLTTQTKIDTDLKLRLDVSQPGSAFMHSDWMYVTYTLCTRGIYHLKYTMYIPDIYMVYHDLRGIYIQYKWYIPVICSPDTYGRKIHSKV